MQFFKDNFSDMEIKYASLKNNPTKLIIAKIGCKNIKSRKHNINIGNKKNKKYSEMCNA